MDTSEITLGVQSESGFTKVSRHQGFEKKFIGCSHITSPVYFQILTRNLKIANSQRARMPGRLILSAIGAMSSMNQWDLSAHDDLDIIYSLSNLWISHRQHASEKS